MARGYLAGAHHAHPHMMRLHVGGSSGEGDGGNIVCHSPVDAGYISNSGQVTPYKGGGRDIGPDPRHASSALLFDNCHVTCCVTPAPLLRRVDAARSHAFYTVP
jgi:hypothetical protein